MRHDLSPDFTAVYDEAGERITASSKATPDALRVEQQFD
jgi:hypothetical protein